MKMKELFDRGEFVVSAEVGPPKGIHVDELVEEAKTYLKDVHAVNVTDNQSSVMRLGSLAMCKVLKDAGMDPIFQLACRDRNRIALESDLLSAAMFGIENILCLTGDHTKMGDHPQAKPVFDLDSVSLLHTVKLLESGVDLGGNELVGEPPKFSKGAVVSPCSDSVDAQLAKMERKVAAGADYFQTQAVFEPEKFIKFMEKAKQFGKPVQVGIIIPKSVGMVRFMNNNVAGIHVPDEMIEELKADKEKTKAGITGVEIAARIIKECKPYSIGSFDKGETVHVRIVPQTSKSALNSFCIAYQNSSAFEKFFSSMQDNSMQITSFSDDHITGFVKNTQAKPLALFTIPYDTDWEIYVNGQPSTSVKLADALLGVKLPADTEICKIELRYVPHTFYIGLAVSGSALLFFLFWYMIFRKKQIQN